MGLRQIAAQMKKLAGVVPFDIAAKVKDGGVLGAFATALADLEKHQRDTVVDGLPIRITYTLDTLPRRCWHLTIGAMVDQPIPRTVVAKVKAAFNFKEDLELPSIHGNRVRQFVQIIDK